MTTLSFAYLRNLMVRIADDALNRFGRVYGINVLPEPKNGVASSFEMLCCVGVTRLVPFDLPPPPFAVAHGTTAVFRTAVPETTIHKHSYLCAGKEHVNPSPGQIWNLGINAVAQPALVKLGSKS